MTNENQKSKFTLEMICQQKADKLAEIRASKERISESVQHLFKPEETTEGTQALMYNFKSGMAIINGLVTGFKIIKRIRNFFRKT